MKKSLIFLNRVPEKYANHESYVKEIITDFFDSLNFDIKLTVKFVDLACYNEYEIADCLIVSKSAKKHELQIDNSLVNTINFDRGANFIVSIYHEFEHLRDHVNMMQTKLFNFNLCLAHQKNLERTYVSVGFTFWTEVYAYYNAIDFANENNFYFEKITFGNLVKYYKKTVDFDKKIYYKRDLTPDEAYKYIKSVDSFIYLCSKFIASAHVRHSKVPYKKIDNDKDYRKVYSILCGIEPKVNRIEREPYGPKAYENLYKLGAYICYNVKWKIFKVGLTKSHNKITTFY